MFGQVFDQIFGQGFDQGLGEGNLNTVYSTTRPKEKKPLTLLNPLKKGNFNKRGVLLTGPRG